MFLNKSEIAKRLDKKVEDVKVGIHFQPLICYTQDILLC